jgi:hypothetical protein
VKKFLITTAVLVAAVAVLIGVTLPPRRLALSPRQSSGQAPRPGSAPAAAPDGTIPGAIHVHTNRSDGLSSPDEIAAAASRAGLAFVVFTDHGDGTRRSDPPAYRSGVLCLDGVEISTNGGHYIALDMPASPYPLGGEARDVVEDVRRLGGFGIAAHPDSPKLQLRWREWTAPFDAMEVFNLDSGWRLWAEQAGGSAGKWRARRHLAAALFHYPFRSAETIAGLIRSGEGLPYQWAALAARRRVVVLAGVDAHARLDLGGDPADSRFALPLPGYESSFRVLSIRVRPDSALSGNAAADGAILMRAIRAGHLYTAVDAVATPPSFEFTATNDRGTASEGDQLDAGGPVTLRVRSNAPPGFTTTVWNGTNALGPERHEQDFTVQVPADPAVYSVDIRAPGTRGGASTVPSVAWIRSNAIYVRNPDGEGRLPARAPATVSTPIFDGRTATGWRAEHDPTSLAVVEAAPSFGGAELRFRYGLASGTSPGRVAALVFDTPGGTAPNDRLTLTIRAERPMRIALQLRMGDDQGEASSERWQRSLYIDTSEQERTIHFDELLPVGETHTFRPVFPAIRSVLLVVDATNTKPGDSGRVWIKKAELQR